MTKRSRDWNESLSKDLRDPEFAREFILASLDEGLELQVVLAKVVRAFGVKEFAKKIKMASPNLLRAIDPKHNPTQDTLNRLLKPLGLQLTVALINTNNSRRAS
jgi:DNA-binding phage protein